MVTTDAPFHTPDGTHQNDATTTTTALNNEQVVVIGLKAPGSGTELDTLASNTSGTVQPLSSDGSNIGQAILDGLAEVKFDVGMASDCSIETGGAVTTSFDGPFMATAGDVVNFTETITVSATASGGTYTCQDWATINGVPMTDAAGDTIFETKTIHVPSISLDPETDTNDLTDMEDHPVTATVTANDVPLPGVTVKFNVTSGPSMGEAATEVTDGNGQATFTIPAPDKNPGNIGVDDITAQIFNMDMLVGDQATATKEWADLTPPVPSCVETVNPNGKQKPTAPGNGGQGQNQDGFYEISAEDVVWPPEDLELFVTDGGASALYEGPFPVGTRIKYTEDPDEDSPIGSKKIGGNDDSNGNAVDYHIIGRGDMHVIAVDGSGNVSDPLVCLVPPPPQ